MARFRAPRMTTATDWVSPPFRFVSGGSAVSITGWVFEVAAQGQAGRIVLGPTNITAGADQVVLSLTAAQCAALGAGAVWIEIVRASPAPRRSLCRFRIANDEAV